MSDILEPLAKRWVLESNFKDAFHGPGNFKTVYLTSAVDPRLEEASEALEHLIRWIHDYAPLDCSRCAAASQLLDRLKARKQ